MNTLKLIQLLEDALKELREQGAAESAIPETIQLPDRAYAVGKYPVTVAQYNEFCRQTELDPKTGDPNHPVTNVSWDEAQAYCAWLSNKTNNHFRLPTEDEFEHFCGDHKEATPEIAVYNTKSIARVGTCQPNKYGLHDCLGLVWEWQESYYSKKNNDRVIRGGSWLSVAGICHSAYHNWFVPSSRTSYLGFRLLCESR